MAITETILKKSLVINLKDGYDNEGNEIFKNHIYNSIDEKASNEDIYAAGVEIAKLIEKDLQGIAVTEKVELSE